MGIIEDYGSTLLLLTIAFGFFMAWGVGANDVANAMGTSVGAKAITLKQAIIIAMVFEFAGAYLAGGEVTSTIRKGIIDPELLADDPDLLVFGMMSALLAAGIWLMIATAFGCRCQRLTALLGRLSDLHPLVLVLKPSTGQRSAALYPAGWYRPYSLEPSPLCFT